MVEPKLRFKKEDGTAYPPLRKAVMGDFYIERNERGSESLPVLTVSIHSGVSDGELDEDELGKRVKRSVNLTQYKKAEKGDLVFNMMRAWQGAVGSVKTTGMVSPAYIVAKPNLDLDPSFMDYYVQTKPVIDRFNRLSYGAIDFRKRLYWDSFITTEVSIPTIQEQQKIADFLSSVDEVIFTSEQEVANLETQKKAVMKKIFSQEVRFKKADGSEFPEWEEHSLSYYLNIRDEKQVPTVEAPLMAFIAHKGVADKGDRYDRSFLVKTDDKKYKRTEYNDFIYSSNNLDVGSIGLNKYGSAVISVVYEIFKVKDTAVPECINEIIQAPVNMAKILQYRQGALYGQYKIHASDFLGVSVSAPCLNEQRLIADFLSDFDEAIVVAKKELELWKELKKGLLQQMFV